MTWQTHTHRKDWRQNYTSFVGYTKVAWKEKWAGSPELLAAAFPGTIIEEIWFHDSLEVQATFNQLHIKCSSGTGERNYILMDVQVLTDLVYLVIMVWVDWHSPYGRLHWGVWTWIAVWLPKHYSLFRDVSLIAFKGYLFFFEFLWIECSEISNPANLVQFLFPTRELYMRLFQPYSEFMQ